MNDIHVSEYTPDLLEDCVSLYIKVFSQEPWCESWESRQVVVDFLLRHCKNSNFLGYVATLQGSVVAASIGFLKPWIKGEEYYIDEFFVDTDVQRQGVGSRFLAGIEQDLLGKGINTIFLNTERGVPAYQFYQKAGFDPLEELVILAKSF